MADWDPREDLYQRMYWELEKSHKDLQKAYDSIAMIAFAAGLVVGGIAMSLVHWLGGTA